MPFVPNTIVKLCSTPLDSTNSNQLRFASIAAQTAYFESVVQHSYSEATGNAFSYQRKDNVIRIPAHIDTLWDVNYAMYQNTNFTNKWFYSFITRMEYASESCTLVYIETDVFQTWFFDVQFKDSFIVREHEITDTVGANVIDEGLELGELVLNGNNVFTGLGDMDIIIASTTSDEGLTGNGAIYNNIYSGVYFYGTHTDIAAIGAFIASKTDLSEIIAIFQVPHLFTNCGAGLTLLTTFTNNINVTAPARPATLDGYTPKNAKLKTFPYSFLYVHNNCGNSAIFRYELFNNAAPAFIIYGGVAPNAVYKLTPMNIYSNGQAQPDYDQGLTLGGFPVCAWQGDVFSTWLAQNTGSVIVGLAGGALTLGAGIAALNPLMVAGGALAIGGSLASISQKSMQPPQANGSINSPNANCSNEWNDFTFCPKSIRANYAAIIDSYFDMFGYKQNKVKVPNMSSRPYWNYVKTIDANITGDIPADDMTKLKTILNNGVTIWHNPANVGNYALNNH